MTLTGEKRRPFLVCVRDFLVFGVLGRLDTDSKDAGWQVALGIETTLAGLITESVRPCLCVFFRVCCFSPGGVGFLRFVNVEKGALSLNEKPVVRACIGMKAAETPYLVVG